MFFSIESECTKSTKQPCQGNIKLIAHCLVISLCTTFLRWTLPTPWAAERLVLTHDLFTTPGLVLSHLNSIAKPLNHKFFPSGTAVDVLHIIGSGLEVACCIVRLRDEDVVLCAIINRLI